MFTPLNPKHSCNKPLSGQVFGAIPAFAQGVGLEQLGPIPPWGLRV